MSERDPHLLVADMIDAIEKILSYTAGISFDDYFADSKTRDAVLRNIIVLGEAAKHVPADFRSRHASIEWDKIARSRHVVVHDYFDVDHEIVWRIVEDHLPPLLKSLRQITP